MEEQQPKVILITGASSGIGEATVRMLAAQGHRLVIGARRAERLAELAAEVAARGGTVIHQGLDVTSAAGVNAFAQRAFDSFGQIDVIVNNAGVMPLSPLPAITASPF
jgi:NADP-dependent 3-hydroxy acid dehydrogenase YdfG